MIQLDPSVIAAIEKLESQPETAWDTDLLRVREWEEGALMPGEDWHLTMRFIHDTGFCRLVMPVKLAAIEARHRQAKDLYP
jgi:hypothetical protein